MIKVCVIGAGGAGLVALRNLSANPSLFKATAYEQSNGVGGTWVYTDHVDTDVHSSMYKNLRTNLPKEVMGFPDYPFNAKLPSFISHVEVQKYLEDYTENFQLKRFIQFRRNVTMVTPAIQDSKIQWIVETVGSDDKKEEKSVFDAVMVCNGHYSVPLVPSLIGIDEFQGQVLHSHNYKDPEAYKDKTVLILGMGASGTDIALDLAPNAKQVIISHNKPPHASPLPDNVRQVPGTNRMTQKGAILKSDELVECDVLMFCTGYHYSFPFLSKECGLNITDERLTPLYKHLILINNPTLCIVGICKTICPFPQFYNQALFFVKTLDGTVSLPSRDEKEEFEWRLSLGMSTRHAHSMGKLQWKYNNDLSEVGKFEAIPTKVMTLYDEVHRMRRCDLINYKTINYTL